KLVATIDPTKPVIDSIVFQNVGYRLPTGEVSQRIRRIVELYDSLADAFVDYLGSECGHYLVRQFKNHYPSASLSETKMLDLVLWQKRKAKNETEQPKALASPRV